MNLGSNPRPLPIKYRDFVPGSYLKNSTFLKSQVFECQKILFLCHINRIVQKLKSSKMVCATTKPRHDGDDDAMKYKCS